MHSVLLPTRPRLFFSLVLTSFLSPWVFAQSFPPPALSALGAAILQENDPAAAKKFLGDRESQQREKIKDPVLFDKLFARALELKDLSDLEDLLVRGPADPRPIRLGLSVRTHCVFCRNPIELLKWTDRYFNLDAASRQVLRSAVWEWSELPKERQEWLAAKGEIESAWSAHDFSLRQAKLKEWALAKQDALLKLSPSTLAEVQQMEACAEALRDVLSDKDIYPLIERINQVALPVERVEAIRKVLLQKKDKKNKELLADLDSAPDLETRLSLLSGIFDGADAKSAAMAPSKPGQTFDPQSREMVEGLLRSGLMREIAGTWAGEDLKAFDLSNIKVEKPIFHEARAWYQDGKIHFNEEEIERYVKSSNKTLKDLANPALLAPLLRELAPLFVHEATHFKQNIWAWTQHVPFRAGQGAESEAMQVAALFIVEKMKRDPSYRKFLDETKTLLRNSSEALALANRLQESGPEWFRRATMASHYPANFTIEANEWDQIWRNNDRVPEIEAELLRREGLSALEQNTLLRGREFRGYLIFRQEFSTLIKTFGTTALREELQKLRAEIADAPRIYAAYSDRLARSDALTLERLKMLESETGRTRRAEPPPPGKQRWNFWK